MSDFEHKPSFCVRMAQTLGIVCGNDELVKSLLCLKVVLCDGGYHLLVEETVGTRRCSHGEKSNPHYCYV